ncbi:hypothetical protein B296_00051941 [Ensete ventricosum]|uniref:SWIM-type domain-containing protein n=1 Tax=Ensete ventricosum TaxID=4639 RepID=A0A426YED1_ENSVE|nr:hypothetical protein B296_00051941 [Ensete ventricosum]
MEIKYSIDDLPVQDPPTDEFTASDLTWTKYGSSEHHVDDVALVPYDRVDAFISGECSNPEHPTRFHIERGRKRERGSLKECKSDEYLLYRLYWCSFGPENYGEGGSILPSRRYRLNTRNRAARPQSMRGCTCHFAIKRLYARPSIALIIYHERRHVNKSGFICHGPLDRDAIGPGAKKVPYICSEIQQQTMSLIYLGIPEENVLQTHIEGVQRYCDPNASVNSLASQYVQKLGMIIKRSTHELDLDDQASIRILFYVYIYMKLIVLMLEMWLGTIKSLPLASQESCGAIEGYHVKLKLKVYDDSHLGALQRVDWLVHKLTTELHSGYWLDLYADESGSFPSVKEEYILSTSWHRALQVPDDAVTFDDKEHLFAKVLSQKDGGQERMVWNPGSEFALCDCSWSMQGNLCKHIIKVNLLCQHKKEFMRSLSHLSFQEVLLNLWRKPMDDSLSLDLSMSWVAQMQDKIQRLVELITSGDIAKVTNKLPLKWIGRRERTSVGKPTGSSTLSLRRTNKGGVQKKAAARRKSRKRKRLSRIKSYS